MAPETGALSIGVPETRTAFNEAGARWPRKPTRARPRCTGTGTFNEAGARWPRKPSRGFGLARRTGPLQ